jgi:hypothetical protein
MRQEIPLVILGADGRPYAGASVYVRTSPGGADATVYQARTGGATSPNPLTSDAQGRVTGWLERGDYAATISSVAGLGPWVEEFPIASAFDVQPTIVDTYANRPGGLNGQAGTPPPAGVRFLASDKRMEWIVDDAGAWTLVGVYAREVTTLPTSPIDGEECTLKWTAAGVLLDGKQHPAGTSCRAHLRYDAASPYAAKWEVLEVDTMRSATNVQTFATAAELAGWTNILQHAVTIPFPGDWASSVGAMIGVSGGNLGQIGYIGAAVGDTTPPRSAPHGMEQHTFVGGTAWAGVMTNDVHAAVAAAAQIKARASAGGSVTSPAGISWMVRFLEVAPIRLGP